MNDERDGEHQRLADFERRQAAELKDFEADEKRRLAAFEARERQELAEFEREEKREFNIKIDRTEYKVRAHKLNGTQLRELSVPPIGPDRDLFEVVPGGSDKRIEAAAEIRMRDGLRFFTAPAQINPGQS